MLEILGKKYYIDIEAITDKCKSKDTSKKERKKEKTDDGEEKSGIEINLFKYETIKVCLEVVLSEFGEPDDDIEVFAQTKLPISFKIAFNTLLKNELIIEEEDE